MSDRNVFVTAFLTAVLVIAGAFALQQFFYFELAKSAIYVAIAVMVFYGENRFSYMLGIVAPILGFIAAILAGVFFGDFRVLFQYVSGKGVAPLETPLHALSYLVAVLMIFFSWRAWSKEVPEKFLGRTFWTCFVISLVWAGILAGWYMRAAHA